MVTSIIRLENGATIDGIKYPMRKVLIEAGKIWAGHNKQLVITCGSNGEHSYRSYHPFGYALDLRCYFFGKDKEVHVVKKKLKEALGDGFDVVLHETELEDGSVYYSHFHVEFDVERYMKKHNLNGDPMTRIFV